MDDWLIYGATGYAGRLIAREAVSRGLRPILAGRDPESVAAVAREHDCPSRVFALESAAATRSALDGVRLVLHCAGPFSQTARPMIAGCLAARAHYLDITGEIDVIEYAASCDAAARTAGISIIPAVGFDVVPTDCLAAMLADELPGATRLALAFTGSEKTSPGTLKTVLESMPHGGRARVAGRIEAVPFAWKSRTIPFPSGPREGVTIGWGDVSSAFYTTGIPNIETYLASPAGSKSMRRLRRVGPLLRSGAVLRAANWLVDRFVKGPTEEDLRTERVEIWGEVSDDAGQTRTAALETPNGYRLTALAATSSVERLLSGNVAPGFSTPARAFGKDFVLALPGVARRDVAR